MAATATIPRTQLERTALSDARMADAAVKLICERGAAETTLKDVGLLAGYSRGLASYRFGTKAGLWSFLVRTIGEELLAELERARTGEMLDIVARRVGHGPPCRDRRPLPLPARVL